MDLRAWTETLMEIKDLPPNDPRVLAGFLRLRDALEAGTVRAASRGPEGRWQAHPEVKEGILLGFRIGQLADVAAAPPFTFVDKDTWPLRHFTLADRVRLVPGGSAVRAGSFLAAGVVVMPPAYVNVGAYVDEGTLIDSHALVGSCAQVGKRVHLSAGCQVGGVIEPVGALPVVVEDDAFVGGNTGLYEGVQVGAGAVIGSGVVLNASTAVYDLVRREVWRAGEMPLRIPEHAVVVPGSRPLAGEFAAAHHLHVSTPVIVKYRDARTSAKAALEDAIRGF